MTTYQPVTRDSLLLNIALFPTVEDDGFGLRPGTRIYLNDVTADGVQVGVRLGEGLFGLNVPLGQSDGSYSRKLVLADVVRAMRATHGPERCAAAFQM